MQFLRKIGLSFFLVLLFQNFIFAQTTPNSSIPPPPTGERRGIDPLPPELQEIGVQEHLGSFVTKDLKFKNEKGEEVLISSFFDQKRPVILTLVYYTCPNLCNFLLNGLNAGLRQMNWKIGDQFQLVTVSIDPTEKSELAVQKKESYLKEYGKPGAEKGWHFLTGSEDQIKKLAGEVGFKYKYDSDQKQYAHGAVIFVLTPEGKISRYLYGIEFHPQDLKLALLEASNGKIGNAIDRFLMFCYHYDPKGKKYALFATNLMKVGGLITVVLLGSLLFFLYRKKR